MVPKSNMIYVLTRRGEETQIHRQMGRRSSDDRGRDWSDASTSQGKSRIAGNHQKLGRVKEVSFPRVNKDREHQREHGLAGTFISNL